MSLFREGLSFSRIKQYLGLLKKKCNLGDKWVQTNDIYAHSPTFPIICGHCGSKMMLRYTEILPHRGRVGRINEGVNNMAYKCPRCHVMYKFFIPDDTAYLVRTIDKFRDGFGLYLPPKSEWEKENEEIKKRLETLGYM